MNPSTNYLVRKNVSENKKFLPYAWHGLSVVIWFLLYNSYSYFLSNKNDFFDFTVAFIMSVIILALFQEALVNKLVKIFPFWLITVIAGFLFGLIYTFVFLGSLLFFPLGAGIVASSFNNVGYEMSFSLLTIFILTTTGIIFSIFTYGVWAIIIKPIHKSNQINEKGKLVFNNIVITGGSLFVSTTLLFSFLLVFNSNMLISSLLSVVAFSFLTFSGFKDMYFENSISKPFRMKSIERIQTELF